MALGDVLAAQDPAVNWPSIRQAQRRDSGLRPRRASRFPRVLRTGRFDDLQGVGPTGILHVAGPVPSIMRAGRLGIAGRGYAWDRSALAHLRQFASGEDHNETDMLVVRSVNGALPRLAIPRLLAAYLYETSEKARLGQRSDAAGLQKYR